MKQFKSLLTLGIMVLAISSCKTPTDVVYLQDLTPDEPKAVQAVQYITIKPNDKLLINVHSRDEKISELFNVHSGSGAYGNLGAGNYGNGSSSSTIDLSAYNVSADGDINFPVLGTIHVGGLTRQQVADHIRDILIEENLVKDPYVTCAFVNSFFYTLGELNSHGRVQINRDAETIVEAIAAAGDISIQGRRQDIQVIRMVNGKLHTYEIDLTNATNITNSPAYYIQPNDIIYVRPTAKRQFETTALGNSVRTPSFWLGLAGTILSLGITIYSLVK